MTTSDTPTDRVPNRVPTVSHTPPRADARRSCLSVPPPTGTDTISEPAATVSTSVSQAPPDQSPGASRVGAVEAQLWEQRITGTDVATQRLHLVVDEHGRVTVHEAVLGRLLLEAGWERAR